MVERHIGNVSWCCNKLRPNIVENYHCGISLRMKHLCDVQKQIMKQTKVQKRKQKGQKRKGTEKEGEKTNKQTKKKDRKTATDP